MNKRSRMVIAKRNFDEIKLNHNAMFQISIDRAHFGSQLGPGGVE